MRSASELVLLQGLMGIERRLVHLSGHLPTTMARTPGNRPSDRAGGRPGHGVHRRCSSYRVLVLDLPRRDRSLGPPGAADHGGGLLVRSHQPDRPAASRAPRGLCRFLQRGHTDTYRWVGHGPARPGRADRQRRRGVLPPGPRHDHLGAAGRPDPRRRSGRHPERPRSWGCTWAPTCPSGSGRTIRRP